VLETRWGILAGAGTKLVLAGPGEQLTLLEGDTGSQRRLPRPSTAWDSQPAVDPRGRFVALVFGIPAWYTSSLPKGWKGGPLQVLDVWILDTQTAKLTQLPGMPAFMAIKRSDVAWTNDGRLVLLGHTNGEDVVAVWRPGQRRLALKTVQLPELDGGSRSFAILG